MFPDEIEEMEWNLSFHKEIIFHVNNASGIQDKIVRFVNASTLLFSKNKENANHNLAFYLDKWEIIW